MELTKEQLAEYLERVRVMENDVNTLLTLGAQIPHCFRHASDLRMPQPPTFTLQTPTKEISYKDSVLDVLIDWFSDGEWLIPYVGMIKLISRLKNRGRDAKQREEENERRYLEALAYFKRKESEYEQAIQQWRHDQQQEKQRYLSECDQVNAYNDSLKHQLDDIIETARQTRSALAELYSANIIHEKYRGLLPVTRFCEYLSTGRREKLDGINGMYDLYEEEVRMGAIFNSLQDILSATQNLRVELTDSMRNIAENQNALICQLKANHAQASSLAQQISQAAERTASSMQKIEQQNAAIQSATAWTAYTSALTARNAEALQSLDHFRYVHHI